MSEESGEPLMRLEDELPHVISESVLEIGPCKLRCYVLSDGRRIFDAEDVKAFFGPEVWAEISGALEHAQASGEDGR